MKDPKMPVKIETIASIVAIILSVGTIFYHAVVVKRNVEILTIQSDKSEGKIQIIKNKIQINDKEIQLVKSELKFNKEKVNEINTKLSEVHQVLLESSQETRKILIKALENFE